MLGVRWHAHLCGLAGSAHFPGYLPLGAEEVGTGHMTCESADVSRKKAHSKLMLKVSCSFLQELKRICRAFFYRRYYLSVINDIEGCTLVYTLSIWRTRK